MRFKPKSIMLLSMLMALAVGVSASAASAASWRAYTPPDPGEQAELTSISCTSVFAGCKAVGRYKEPTSKHYVTLAETWKGGELKWSTQPTVNPNGATASKLSGVSCVMSSVCLAVGEYSTEGSQAKPLAETWSGTAWSLVTVSTPEESTNVKLEGVSCFSGSQCTVVGSYSKAGSVLALAEKWNGGNSWTIQAPANPGSSPHVLNSVSCGSGLTCTAVGVYGAGIPLVEHFASNAWTTETTPDTSASLHGVSCLSTTYCTAVGQTFPPKGAFEDLAEGWNGTKWSHQSTPNPGSAENELLGVSCTSSTFCSSAGLSRNTVGSNQSVVQKWNGTEWLTQEVPNPTGATSSQLASISCTGTTEGCMAVGHYNTEKGALEPLAEFRE